MIQAIRQPLTFEEFLDWYPEDGNRYELMDGEVFAMRPAGDHEELAGVITRLLDREIERQNFPYLIPKSCCIKPASAIDGYVPDVVVLDRRELSAGPLWKKASTITRGRSVALVIEVVSTNWQDDYARKLEDYEAMGIREYWIVDYRALGGKRYIGDPKQPTLSIYSWVEGHYQIRQFLGRQQIISTVFPGLQLDAEQILIVN